MSIFFARQSLRDSPSALEAYLEEKGLLESNSKLARCTVFENIDPISDNVAYPRPRVLIRTEPFVVSPDSYNSCYVGRFDLVISMGTVGPEGGRVLGWPQVFGSLSDPRLPELADRFDQPVMVASDKISFVVGELYSLRRRALFGIPELALFGFAWGNRIHIKALKVMKEFVIALRSGAKLSPFAMQYFFKHPRSYQGQVENKRKTICRYRYCVVIENEATYVSEKLFDALFAGCIPIYVGPKLQTFGFPAGLVVEVEGSVSSIREGIATARGLDFVKWEELRVRFLTNPETIFRWNSADVYDEIVRRLNEISNRQEGPKESS